MSVSLSPVGPMLTNPTRPSAFSERGRLVLTEDPAPPLDPLVDLRPTLVEDVLRHQSRIGVVSAWIHRRSPTLRIVDLVSRIMPGGRGGAAGLPGVSTGVLRSGPGGRWLGRGGEGVVQGVADQLVQAGFPGPVTGQVQDLAVRGVRD